MHVIIIVKGQRLTSLPVATLPLGAERLEGVRKELLVLFVSTGEQPFVVRRVLGPSHVRNGGLGNT